jgi:hypothetical protein
MTVSDELETIRKKSGLFFVCQGSGLCYSGGLEENHVYVISGFRCGVDEDCALLGYYAASSDNLLPTFRDNLSVPSSFLKMGPINFPVTSKLGPIGFPAKSIRNYHYSLRNNPEEGHSQLRMCLRLNTFVGRDSSVGMATGYGLDGPGIESRWGRDFSHKSNPGLGAHPASCAMGTGSFPGVKRPGRGADHPPPPIPQVKKN